jgi:hypothetical protein
LSAAGVGEEKVGVKKNFDNPCIIIDRMMEMIKNGIITRWIMDSANANLPVGQVKAWSLFGRQS